MLYRNTLTGAAVNTKALIEGKNWIKVEDAPKEKKEEPKAKKKDKK